MTREETEDLLAGLETGFHEIAEAVGETYRSRDQLSDAQLLAVAVVVEEFQQDIITFISKLEAIPKDK